MKVNKEIAKKIRITRAAADPYLTQTEFLAKLQLLGFEFSQATLSKIERGKRNVTAEELSAIAEVLNVDMLWLLGKTEIKF